MKRICLLLLLFACFAATGQTYSSLNIDLLSVIDPDTNPPKSGNRYSGCWGWYQASKNKEYAISGGRNGTWFIDVTNPATPSVSAYVPGISKSCTWRELKTYQNYCYIVSDVCHPNGFQIVDMQYLPDSVKVIHSDTTLFILGHTAWVDKDKLYVGTTNFGSGGGYSPMSVWSLANPASPKLYRRLEKDDKTVGEVHDMYVRNDTIYASAGYQGLRIYKLNGDSTISPLGSYTGYEPGNYNHSSFLTANGKYLMFCDEVPQGRPIRLVDVQNLSNIQPVSTWHPWPKTTPHNPYIIGNRWAVVSSYQDGLFIYDISLAPWIGLSGYFDTYHQGGYNKNDYGAGAYAGNWGAYPYLPSGIIVANDMQNGVYLLDPSDAYNTTHYASVKEDVEGAAVRLFPNPVSDELRIRVEGGRPFRLGLYDMMGRLVALKDDQHDISTMDVAHLPEGCYALHIDAGGRQRTEKVVVTH